MIDGLVFQISTMAECVRWGHILELELELLSVHLMDPSCLASLASTFLDTLMNLAFSTQELGLSVEGPQGGFDE